MRTHLQILLLISFILSPVYSFSQQKIAKYYCQDCCGFTGYYLRLVDDYAFQMLYTDGRDIDTLHAVYGAGNYTVDQKRLILNFVESLREKVETLKIRDSDSLIIHFMIVDDMAKDSLVGTIVRLRKNVKDSFVFYKNQGTLRTTFNRSETIRFDVVGFNLLEYKIASPGEYQMKVNLIPYMGANIRSGDTVKFKIKNKRKFKRLKGLRNRKLKFTTKPCDVIIT